MSKKNGDQKRRVQTALWTGFAVAAALVYKRFSKGDGVQGGEDDAALDHFDQIELLTAEEAAEFGLPRSQDLEGSIPVGFEKVEPVDQDLVSDLSEQDTDLAPDLEAEVDPKLETPDSVESLALEAIEQDPEADSAEDDTPRRRLLEKRQKARAKRRQRRRLDALLLVFFLCTAVFSGYKLYGYVRASQEESRLSEELRREFRPAKPNVEHRDRFAGLKGVNEDIVGWIRVPDTRVDYPVLQSYNNDFYLRRNALKEYALHGSVFMDTDSASDASGLHTIIYGHNMKDGSMFGSLSQLKKKEVFDRGWTVVYEYPGGRSEWEIFSLYVYKPSDDFFEFDFPDLASFHRYVLDCAAHSMHGPTEIEELPDRLLTLMTCTYEFQNSRLVVHAKPVSL